MISFKHQIRQYARQMFRDVPVPGRWIQTLRPRICPFNRLIGHVPPGSSLLDVGCGSGLFLGLLASGRFIGKGIGFDANADAIDRAEAMRSALEPEQAERIEFLRRDARDPWPEGTFDVVALVDVLHHVPPASQQSVFIQAVEKIKPGGRLLYKDMARRPRWSALANRLHDLVMAREWIHYRDINDVRRWGCDAGLTLTVERRKRLYWYTHEWLVFDKPR